MYMHFDIRHSEGEIRTALPPSSIWTSRPNRDSQQDEEHVPVLEVDFDYTNYKDVPGFDYQKIHQLSKNSFTGGNKIRLHVLDGQNKKLMCKYKIEMYKSLEEKEQ